MQGGQIVPLDLPEATIHSEAEAYCIRHLCPYVVAPKGESHPCTEDSRIFRVHTRVCSNYFISLNSISTKIILRPLHSETVPQFQEAQGCETKHPKNSFNIHFEASVENDPNSQAKLIHLNFPS